MLINQSSTTIFPQDPYSAHTPKGGRTHDEIKHEKMGYSWALEERASQFTGVSKELALAAIPLMQEFHFNQFRAGVGTPHYTQHTTAVSLIASEAINLAQSPYPIHAANGEIIDPQAIAFVVGALHDSEEDFFKNFRGTANEINAEEGAKIVEARIKEKFTPIVGTNATEEITKLIRILSLTNDAEFPTKDYVDGIIANCYTRAVKQADYSHNIPSFPDFTPSYPLIIVPAQYQPIVAGTYFERNYAEGLLLNLAKFNPDEIVPWDRLLKERGIKSVEHLVGLCELYNEPLAVERVRAYYLKLYRDITNGGYDGFLNMSGLSREVAENISPLLRSLTPPLPSYLQGVPTEESSPSIPLVSESHLGNVPLRILGPMSGWGCDISFPREDLKRVERVIVETSAQTQQRIPGYFAENDAETMKFHISRYPRREGQAVPPISDYRAIIDALKHNLESAGITVSIAEEPLDKTPTLRVVLGLEEGYFDGRRKEVLSLVEKGDVSNKQELDEALAHLIGDYEAQGITIGAEETFEDAVARIKLMRLSVIHTVEETEKYFEKPFTVTPVRIFSAASEYSTPYQEPAAMIVLPATKENVERLVDIADRTKQARFSVEKLDSALVVNVEISAFSQAKSAG